MMEYYAHVVAHSSPGQRNGRELHTLCMIGDLLLSNRWGLAGDTLAQRVRAIETSIADRSWAAAEKMELLPPTTGNSTTEGDYRRAVSAATRDLRVQRAMSSLRTAPPSPTAAAGAPRR